MKIGATLEKTEIGYWEPKLSNNAWMRVFPNSDGLIPVTSDTRYAYATANGMRIIFVSSKIDKKYGGTFSAGLAIVIQRIKDLIDTGDFDLVYYCEHHEAEADYLGTTARNDYKTKQGLVFDAVEALPPAYRAKVRAGHIATRQWTEDASKGNFDYKPYDTGRGDFFGIDMYGNSYSGGAVITAAPNVATFLQYVKAYQYDASDTRERIFPEFSIIGWPADTTTGARAAFMRAVHEDVKTWNPTSTPGWARPWSFGGWIWWNTEGTSGGALTGSPGIGTKRWFQLDRRHNGNDLATGEAPAVNDHNNYDTKSGSGALALLEWNAIAAEEAAGTPPPTGPTYAEGVADGRAAMRSECATWLASGASWPSLLPPA